MKTFDRILFVGHVEGHLWRRYATDALLATFASLVVAFFLFIAQLYPRIPNISILHLLVVLRLASKRGLYAAVIASLVAFFSFDYLLVPPFFTFVIYRLEE